jgi:hypothetical protein
VDLYYRPKPIKRQLAHPHQILAPFQVTRVMKAIIETNQKTSTIQKMMTAATLYLNLPPQKGKRENLPSHRKSKQLANTQNVRIHMMIL